MSPRNGRCQYHFYVQELQEAKQFGWVSEDRITIFFHGAQYIDETFDLVGDEYAAAEALEPDGAGWIYVPGTGAVFINPYITINDRSADWAPGQYNPDMLILEHEFGHYFLRTAGQRGYDLNEHYNDGQNVMNKGQPVEPRFHSFQDIVDIHMHAFLFNMP